LHVAAKTEQNYHNIITSIRMDNARHI